MASETKNETKDETKVICAQDVPVTSEKKPFVFKGEEYVVSASMSSGLHTPDELKRIFNNAKSVIYQGSALGIVEKVLDYGSVVIGNQTIKLSDICCLGCNGIHGSEGQGFAWDVPASQYNRNLIHLNHVYKIDGVLRFVSDSCRKNHVPDRFRNKRS